MSALDFTLTIETPPVLTELLKEHVYCGSNSVLIKAASEASEAGRPDAEWFVTSAGNRPLFKGDYADCLEWAKTYVHLAEMSRLLHNEARTSVVLPEGNIE